MNQRLKKKFQTLPITASSSPPSSPEDPFLSTVNIQGEKPWTKSPEQEIRIEQIHLPVVQFRLYHDPDKIATLRATIRSVGIKEPLLLRPHPTRVGDYELIAGSDRREAALQEGLTTVPAKIDDVDDLTAIKICFIENKARSDPNPYEYSRYLLYLLEKLLGLQQAEIFERLQQMYNLAKGSGEWQTISDASEIAATFESVGIKWQSFVSNHMPLLKKIKPDVQEALEQGGLAYTKALQLNRVNDDRLRKSLLKKTIAENLSVEALKSLIAAKKPQDIASPQTEVKTRINHALKQLMKPRLLKNEAVLTRLQQIATEIESLLAEQNNL